MFSRIRRVIPATDHPSVFILDTRSTPARTRRVVGTRPRVARASSEAPRTSDGRVERAHRAPRRARARIGVDERRFNARSTVNTKSFSMAKNRPRRARVRRARRGRDARARTRTRCARSRSRMAVDARRRDGRRRGNDGRGGTRVRRRRRRGVDRLAIRGRGRPARCEVW